MTATSTTFQATRVNLFAIKEERHSRAPAKRPTEELKIEEPASEINTRSALAKWSGEIGWQLPRGFKETSWTTRNNSMPFPRPGTELPAELEKLMADKPGENKTLLLLNFSDVFHKPGM